MPPGSPLPASRFHVAPPSVDLYSPDPGPPDDRFHGCRRTCQSAAYTTLAFDGSNCTSIAPVSLSLNSTFCQCAPPSVVRNTPRSALGPNAWPSAATNTRIGSFGSTITRPMCRVSRSPTDVHVRPASSERYTPVPYEMLPRMHAS